MSWGLYLQTLWILSGLACIAWLYSVVRNNVNIVDSLWPLFFLAAAGMYAAESTPLSQRSWLTLLLVMMWSLRLSIYITARNRGEAEDSRYRKIRQNHSPGFAFKSLFIVFLLQSTLAWLISLPLLGAVTSASPLGLIDALAVTLFLVGLVFEAGGDYQLARFKADPDNEGKVLDSGLWRYTRHPNYFGDFCIWWAFFLLALAAGAWWSIISPLLMTFLLLRVSGVAMLEKTIGDRRPEYAAYIEKTNAFFPGPRKAGFAAQEAGQ